MTKTDGDSKTQDTVSAASEQATVIPDQPELQAAQGSARFQLEVDDAHAQVLYSNTARVWGSAEEINVDFAGPIRPTNRPQVARLKIDQRVVLNPWAAKRLAVALNQAIVRYEQVYGRLELDERNRRITKK